MAEVYDYGKESGTAPGRMARVPAAAPMPKVVAAGTAGAVTVVLVYVLSLLGVDLPDTVATAVTALLVAGTAYLKR